MVDSDRPSGIGFSIFLLCQVYIIHMVSLEMAGMLFYVKGFRFQSLMLLVVNVLDNIHYSWASVPNRRS